MCPRCVKTHDFIALQVFNNIHAASLPQNVKYCVIAIREGGQPGDACRLFGHATTPYGMYEGPVRCSGGIATPPRAPVPPNPVAFDHGI